MCYSHSSYSAEKPSEYLVNNNGQFIDKKGIVVPETKKVKNEYYEEYSEKWGDSNSKNLSLPILVPSTKSKEVLKYEKDPF